ncbi:MAG: multidrug transporter [Anaerolineae bacterium]|nr:multidrug transporter [Anaerolineae bacterium]
MYRYVLEDTRHVLPFNEPASKLIIGTSILSFQQDELFARRFKGDLKLGDTFRDRERIRYIRSDDEAVVYRDSLWFDQEFIDTFIERARAAKRACRAAIFTDERERAFTAYTLPLTVNFEPSQDPATGRPIALADIWYFPAGYTEDVLPIPIESESEPRGFYSVPDFMAQDKVEELTHHLPKRAILSIESWVHIYYASVIFGVFTRGFRFEEEIKRHNFKTLKLLWRGILEQKQVLTTSAVVKVGKDTVIDPSAIISGPTTIGERCYIGPGAVIDNSSIGDDVTVSQGCQVMLSTIANNSFLPFRASLFMTSLMSGTIIAQNTCLQMCVIGRDSFVGAGNTFTDFNLIGEPDGRGGVVPRSIKASNLHGELENVGQVVLGGAVGHNCRIGSGMIIFPGRMIESDVTLFASAQRRVITRDVTFEESDHHSLRMGESAHLRQYPRQGEQGEDIATRTWEKW